MNKTITFAVLIAALVTLAWFSDGENITSASVIGQTKCVGANAAMNFINDKGCERINEDPKCEERGLIEIRC